jgi:hypothetical protein
MFIRCGSAWRKPGPAEGEQEAASLLEALS